MSPSRVRGFGRFRSFDWLVVGAGLTGATLAERIASQLGQTVLVIDRREHIGGNAFDMVDENGIRVHRYGAHLFHTSSEPVWTYLSRFTNWTPYEHRVLAQVSDRLVPLPCNLNTIDALFEPTDARRLKKSLIETFGYGTRVPVLKLMEHPDKILADLGKFAYESIFLNYTVKQWGRRPEELDPAVTGRVPVLVSRDDRYFQDPYQALPAEGYTKMVERMLSSEKITVATGTDFGSLGTSTHFKRTVFTGPIDEYFEGVYGPLPYRSLRFEDEVLDQGPFQPVSVVNYPNDHKYTRIIEHAHISKSPPGATRITMEYPEEYSPGYNEPYYPLPTKESRHLYDKYEGLLCEVSPSTVFAGRLAKYRYFDMDQAVSAALQIFKRQICVSNLAAV